MNRISWVMKQAAAAVLLFVFLAGVSFAGLAEDLAAGKALQDVIERSLLLKTTVDDLVADLIAAGVNGKDIICGLFNANAAKAEVIGAALGNGMDKLAVAQWSYQCGASREDIQKGFGMANESLPAGSVFLQAEKGEESAKEYLYNSSSPSK